MFVLVTLNLFSKKKEVTGILPFLVRPEVIFWRNRVFVAEEHSDEYSEVVFAMADAPGTSIIVNLQTLSKDFIANALVPNYSSLPGVIRWGERIFKLCLDDHFLYREAFYALAHNPKTNTAEIWATEQ